jgi:hypothetical protein
VIPIVRLIEIGLQQSRHDRDTQRELAVGDRDQDGVGRRDRDQSRPRRRRRIIQDET